MDRRNRLLFGDISTQDYRRTDEKLIENINLFFGQAQAENSGEWFPMSAKNPCTRCGECEMKCTQKLRIIECIDDIYKRAGKCGFSLEAREMRLKELLRNKGYKKVGLYPKDRFADMIIKMYGQFWGKPEFEWVAFNSDSSMWGRISDGLTIHAPGEIANIKPDVIIVCNYTYQEEIYTDLQRFQADGIDVVKLHDESYVPWVF
jgi:ferredoxin